MVHSGVTVFSHLQARRSAHRRGAGSEKRVGSSPLGYPRAGLPRHLLEAAPQSGPLCNGAVPRSCSPFSRFFL